MLPWFDTNGKDVVINELALMLKNIDNLNNIYE